MELRLEATSGTRSIKAARGRAQPEAAPANVDTGKPSTLEMRGDKAKVERTFNPCTKVKPLVFDPDSIAFDMSTCIDKGGRRDTCLNEAYHHILG